MIHKSVTGITRSGLKRSYLPRDYKLLSKPKKKKTKTGHLMESGVDPIYLDLYMYTYTRKHQT
jgi:hypothetical protein